MTGQKPTVALIGICALSFFVNASYALARPTSESLFVEAHTSAFFPYAWLVVALGVTLTVMAYGVLVARRPLAQAYAISAVVSVVFLGVILTLRQMAVPYATFALYIWKEIYIVVLLEGLWTLANCLFKLERARWFYGIFLIVGSLAGLSMNLAVGPLTTYFGTEGTLLFTLPFIVAAGLTPLIMQAMGVRAQAPVGMKSDLVAGFRVIAQSRYLHLLLALIFVIQIVVTLTDYEYNVMLEALHPHDKDARSTISGQVYAAIDGVALLLQLLAGIILKSLGVGRVLLSVPVLLSAAFVAFLVYPRFLAMAVAKVTSKALDYSLTRASKELLYLPLSEAEKRQGKAVVDIMGYRVAKGAASLLLLTLSALSAPLWVITASALFLLGIWGGLVSIIVRRYRDLVALAD